jgi:ATPase subunit of ABC transporter with duplicated ATPase domains
VIRFDNIAKHHGRQILFVDSSASIERGEKVGLVGPNGSGKSTLFRLIVKEEEPDGGSVTIDRDVSISYFRQEVGELRDQTVLAAAMDGVGPISELVAELSKLEAALADPEQADEMETLLERYGEQQTKFEELGGYALEAQAREVLTGLGFAPERLEQDVGELSGGWKMRVALAQVLLRDPDVLLLDEPTNHLDLESILWLEGFLGSFKGAIVMTCHDREFMNRLVGKIIDIDAGEFVSYSGNHEFFERQRALRAQQAEAQYERQQAMLAKEQAFIDRFKARASHAAQVQSRVKKLDKIEKLEPPRRRQSLKFDFPKPSRSGEDVLTLDNAHKRYGDHVVFSGLSWLVRRRERWCVMGVNGAGKSTLLRMAANVLSPDAGEARLGASIKLGYFSQHAMDVLDPNETVWSTLHQAFPLASVGSLKTLAGVFGFSGEEVDKKISVLSGGEKARVVLARMLYDPPNFLVLDEPTNHLDLDTKALLLDALADYDGTLVVVSHDRHFLGALTNRVLELTPEGPRAYGGGYREYVEQVGYEAPGVTTFKPNRPG